MTTDRTTDNRIKYSDAIVRRARQLHARRVWTAPEIREHLADEGVTVNLSCLKAWLRGDTRRDVGGMA